MNEDQRKLAWQAGKKAGLAGKGRSACNRERGTIFFDDWHDGYDVGLYERVKS